MSKLHGRWRNETLSGETFVVLTQTLRDDGTFETDMRYALADGCRQHVVQRGRYEASGGRLRLLFEGGETEMDGCADPARRFARRPFTEAEAQETAQMLDQEIVFAVDGDTLRTTVQGPEGSMDVEYHRVLEPALDSARA